MSKSRAVLFVLMQALSFSEEDANGDVMKKATIRPRIRVMRGEEIALGPGKVELLMHLSETGSLSEAARRMEMSYMKAWSLVRTMNENFKAPLVFAERGGSGSGWTKLTELGREVVALYSAMEAASLQAMEDCWLRMKRLLAPSKK